MLVHYYDLTAITIYLSHKMKTERAIRCRWNKLFKNKMDLKVNIVERLLEMRKTVNEEYALDQPRIIEILFKVWGSIYFFALIQYNDRVWIFGIFMTIEENRYMYQWISQGCTTRHVIDDPIFHQGKYSKLLHFPIIAKILSYTFRMIFMMLMVIKILMTMIVIAST